MNENLKLLKESGLTRLPGTNPVDIEFQDLSYSVRGGFKGAWKNILKSISGKFRAGEFTAILGPSGSGKSTLLNVLAGYVTSAVTGTITVNERPRSMKIFHKFSTYIMQDDLLQPHLTVQEAMTAAAELKIGSDKTFQQKLAIVAEVLKVLGLTNATEVRTESLSGGQRKRLSIALELVSNPPVIFLDEPTTGLDSFAVKQCLDVLQSLAKQGRTIICTLHQPSTSMLESFDQLYFIADGMCAYNGNASNLVPFLNQLEIPCPITYNPSEYVIELLQMGPENALVLVNGMQNGKINKRDLKAITHQIVLKYDDSISGIYGDTTVKPLDLDATITFPTSSWKQYNILIRRMFLQLRRNKTMLTIHFFHHVFSALLLGGIFFGIGNDALKIYENFKFCLTIMVFFVYTHVMTTVLLLPTDIKILQREYFNRWYGLKPYYAALTVSKLPMLIGFGMIFLIITYFMVNQPLELDRFGMYCLIGLLCGFCSEGLGLAIGSTFSITNGSCVGPSILSPLLALCVYGMGYGTKIEPFMKGLMTLSYMRFTIVGFCMSLFADRPIMDCSDLYCHYKDTKLLLRDLGMEGSVWTSQIIGLCIFTVIFRVITFINLRCRLTSEFSNTIANYANKILRH